MVEAEKVTNPLFDDLPAERDKVKYNQEFVKKKKHRQQYMRGYLSMARHDWLRDDEGEVMVDNLVESIVGPPPWAPNEKSTGDLYFYGV